MLPYSSARRDGDLVYRTASELSLLGPATIPCLCTALGDTDDGVRSTALAALGMLGSEAAPAVLTLSRLLESPNRWLRETVWTNKGANVSEIELALEFHGPAKAVAAWALGKIGPDARPAVPELARLLRDKDPYTQQYAAMALWRVDRDAVGLPMLIAALRNGTDVTTFGRILIVLGEMGPQARSAVPTIIQMLSQPNHLPDLCQLARDALQKIDPDAVATLDEPAK